MLTQTEFVFSTEIVVFDELWSKLPLFCSSSVIFKEFLCSSYDYIHLNLLLTNVRETSKVGEN